MKSLLQKFTVLVFLLLTGACASAPISPANRPSALEPHGRGAAELASLWWVMFWLSVAVFILVMVLMFAAIARRRRGSSDTPPDSHGGDTGRNWILLGGIALPLVVIGIVFGYTIKTLAAVESSHGQAPVKIEVIGRRWWWQVTYPEQGFTTANELHIPIDKDVEIQLQTIDVIHSFWVPELNGKTDLIPNRVNTLILHADKEGVYRGECAEFCGLQHAHMGFMVVVESSEAYDAWLAAQQQAAQTPSDPLALKGQDVFMSQGCVFCHAVRGLQDKSIDRSAVDLGPDLTHLSSRLTIAGASLELNQGNLAGWISDPQHVKPGVLMPNNNTLSSQDLQALLAYLATLR